MYKIWGLTRKMATRKNRKNRKTRGGDNAANGSNAANSGANAAMKEKNNAAMKEKNNAAANGSNNAAMNANAAANGSNAKPAAIGGRRKSRKSRKSKGPSDWLSLVKSVHAELKRKNPDASLGDAMKEASKRKRAL